MQAVLTTITKRYLQNCDLVVEAIKDTGDIKRKQRDLEEQVRSVVSRDVYFLSHDYNMPL